MNKKTNNGNTVLALGVGLMAIIGILVLFADAFDEATWGTGFEAIFGLEARGTVLCIPLLVAFLCSCLSVFLPLFCLFIKGKGRGGMYVFVAALLIASATLMLFGKQFFIQSNGLNSDPAINQIESVGAAYITAAVFNFLGGLLAILGAYAGRSKKDED